MQTEVEAEIQQTTSPVGMPMNTAPKGGAAVPDQAFLDFLRPLHEKFTPRQQELLSKRHKVLNVAHHGRLPEHLAASEATKSEWKIELPEWVADQRNQMTGPADDVASIVYQADFAKLKHPLTFYIPKTESAEEGLWWRDVFQELERYKGLPKGSIKCMALVESHPLAFQIEEFIYNLRDHLLALNLGRWDYMASLIHFNLADPEWVLPDRNTIPHDV